jgi:hypothetical protein
MGHHLDDAAARANRPIAILAHRSAPDKKRAAVVAIVA